MKNLTLFFLTLVMGQAMAYEMVQKTKVSGVGLNCEAANRQLVRNVEAKISELQDVTQVELGDCTSFQRAWQQEAVITYRIHSLRMN